MGSPTTVNDASQYKMKNAASGLVLGIDGQSQTAGTSLVQKSDSGGTDTLWHVMPMSSGQYNVENLLTHQVMGIKNASTQAGAQALQWADNGTPDHLWDFYLLKDGNYLIKNANSGLYLEVANSDATTSATIDQGARRTTGAGCSCQEWTLTTNGQSPYPAPRAVDGTGIYVHDPYVLRDAAGTYWLYGTHQTLASSTDGTTFTYYENCSAAEKGGYTSYCPIIGPDLPSWDGLQTPKSWNSGANTDVWAPSLMVVNGIYYLYYAIPYEPSTGAEALIGLATSSSPTGPWTDQGWVIKSWTSTTMPPSGFTTTTFNAIDPAPFIDASGNWWLVFGSWEDGIHLIQLDPTSGLRLASNSTIYTIAQRGIPSAGEEGPFIYYWNSYYYYFASINVCCSGVSSTYRIIAGRSKTVTGPYLDRGGIDLMQGGGTILLSAHGNVDGPGGQSVFTDDVNGTSTPTLVYHYYDGNANGTPTLGINRLGFDPNGWPYVQ
ncbi:MAG TPA: family 43 glycosylhydrolase [Terracidiphilus sp.]|nr:family 43 glycosylhydrolase [Terracidiphilus sp.]